MTRRCYYCWGLGEHVSHCPEAPYNEAFTRHLYPGRQREEKPVTVKPEPRAIPATDISLVDFAVPSAGIRDTQMYFQTLMKAFNL